jgi:hypothetical protein
MSAEPYSDDFGGGEWGLAAFRKLLNDLQEKISDSDLARIGQGQSVP